MNNTRYRFFIVSSNSVDARQVLGGAKVNQSKLGQNGAMAPMKSSTGTTDGWASLGNISLLRQSRGEA